MHHHVCRPPAAEGPQEELKIVFQEMEDQDEISLPSPFTLF